MAAADDMKLGESTQYNDKSAVLQAMMKKYGWTNIRSVETFPFGVDGLGGGSVNGKHIIVHLHGRVAPGSDYNAAPIGSTYLQLSAVANGVVTEAILYIKKSNGWKAVTTAA